MSDNCSITHVIFDMDGLLLDTEAIYTNIYDDVLSKYNINYTYELKRQMMGMSMEKGAMFLHEKLSIPDEFDTFLHRIATLSTADRFKAVKQMPGAASLVKALSENGIHIALASGSGRDKFNVKSGVHPEIFTRFEHITLPDDPNVKHGKPDPDIYLVSANKFSEKPASMANVLVFEDAIAGVHSALQAGMNVVWIPDSREPEGPIDLPVSPEVSARVSRLTSLLEFDPSEFGMPASISSFRC